MDSNYKEKYVWTLDPLLEDLQIVCCKMEPKRFTLLM